jgi:cell division protease FtsH
VAEEIIYGEDMVTTGASNDIQQVANIAKRMVKEWGMSDKVGRVALTSSQSRGAFGGRMMLRRPTQWGNKIMGVVEEEVERLVNNSYIIAKKVLNDNRALLEHLAGALIDQEVVSAEEFQMMLVEFKAKTIDYKIIGRERNRGKLPFQSMPSTI